MAGSKGVFILPEIDINDLYVTTLDKDLTHMKEDRISH